MQTSTLIKNIINDQKILITGGTGSFGSAFVKEILAKYNPNSIRIYSRDELKQYEMCRTFNDKRLRFLIGDVRDGKRLQRACNNVDIIIHAAALKQVPSCEYNPIEAIKTNIDGAINVIEAALDNNVKKIIALSTDKAVNPINLYGATKLCSDKLFIQANSYVGTAKTMFSVVRYGNVLASRGSVLPLFQQQIKNNQPITITNKNMTRFWITLKQAVYFVIYALKIMHGGEIFVPKIPSMKIIDLIKSLDKKAKLKTIGIRPGEKLDEYLISIEEGRRVIDIGNFYVINPEYNYIDNTTQSIKGTKMPNGFNYNSKDNTQWISRKQMMKILKNNNLY